MKFLPRLLSAVAMCLLASPRGQAQSTDPASPLLAAAPETHCLLLPIDPAVRAARAALIVEAEVVTAQSFRAPSGRIFTRHQLRVFKQLKGLAPATLTVLTEGGTVGLERQQLTNTLSLSLGQQGVFFLEKAAFKGLSSTSGWAVYASQQGFVQYDLSTATATDPFRRYEQLNAAFYQKVAAAAPREIAPNQALQQALARQTAPVAARGLAPVITGLSPLSLPAGTGAVLTISGTGFGATRGTGYVEFRNADDGGASYTKANEDDYVSWSATRIQVRVPSHSATGNPAGTGPVRVSTSEQVQGLSPLPITVIYAAANVEDTNTKQRGVPGHRNQNSSGGITFRFDPSFASNAAATASWQRALASWRCQTGINWEVGPTRTQSGADEDEQNAVGFDGSSELPAGVLGRTTSYYLGCYLPNGNVSFYVQELDMQFDDDVNWQYGPANPSVNQIDFESVAVHELGHAQQLAHLILPTAVMHYAIARGQRSRELAAISDIAGGRYVLRTRGFNIPICGEPAMLPAPLISQNAIFAAGLGVTVQWATRDECFVTEFVVERAPADTTRGWQTLGTVAAGNGTGQYRFQDAQAPTGLLYYRVRVRRPDNSLDTSPPVGVTDDATAVNTLQIFPNPVTGEGGPLGLQYLGTANGSLTVRFYDAVGRYLGGSLLDYQLGLNRLVVTPPDLRPGYYLVRWTDSNGAKGTTPFIRLD
ncbi:matrixin family metalloprotease [Hymenobacter tenuis]